MWNSIIKGKDICPIIKNVFNEQNVNFKKWLDFKVEFTEKYKNFQTKSIMWDNV